MSGQDEPNVEKERVHRQKHHTSPSHVYFVPNVGLDEETSTQKELIWEMYAELWCKYYAKRRQKSMEAKNGK